MVLRSKALGLFATIVALAATTASAADETKSVGIDEARKAVSINFYDEPKIMDPQKADDTVAFMVIGHVFEGLLRLDAANKAVPGVAESWELKDKTKYTFKLRKNAQWHDGQPVTAKDFVYGWRRGVDPKTASQYAFILYVLKNGEAINNGKAALDTLGVKAVDDHTLEVELERPTAYFERLLSFGTFSPARQDYVEKFGEGYAADAEKMAYNGPFTISTWKHNASMVMTKNDKYWNKHKIELNEIAMPYLIRDRSSEFNMFKDGKFAMTWNLSKELLPQAQASKMQIRKYNYGTVWFFQFNTTRPVTGNKNFRKAIQYALNRDEFVKQVEGIPGSKPAFGIVPEYMPGVTKRYGEEFGVAFKEPQLDKAKEHLALAKKELNLKEFPPISILASDIDTVRRDMEYFQRYLKEKLGLDVKLDFQSFKVRLEKSDRKEFDISNSGWGPDYLDAMTFADLYTSWNKNNNSGWSSPDYDAKIKQAMDSVDAKERLKLMSDAEKILVEEAPIVPYFQQFRVYTQDPRLVGVLRRPVGSDPDFYYAKITPAVAKKK